MSWRLVLLVNACGIEEKPTRLSCVPDKLTRLIKYS